MVKISFILVPKYHSVSIASTGYVDIASQDNAILSISKCKLIKERKINEILKFTKNFGFTKTTVTMFTPGFRDFPLII